MVEKKWLMISSVFVVVLAAFVVYNSYSNSVVKESVPLTGAFSSYASQAGSGVSAKEKKCGDLSDVATFGISNWSIYNSYIINCTQLSDEECKKKLEEVRDNAISEAIKGCEKEKTSKLKGCLKEKKDFEKKCRGYNAKTYCEPDARCEPKFSDCKFSDCSIEKGSSLKRYNPKKGVGDLAPPYFICGWNKKKGYYWCDDKNEFDGTIEGGFYYAVACQADDGKIHKDFKCKKLTYDTTSAGTQKTE